MRFCRRLASLSSKTRSLSDSRTVRTSSQARLRTLAPFQINAARMKATAALSAAIENRRHLIGSTRTTLSVSRSRLRRGRALRVADGSSLRATKSRLIEPCEYARSIGAGRDPTLFIDCAHRMLERLSVEIGDDRVPGRARLLAGALLQSAPQGAHESARLSCGVPKYLLVLGR